MFLTAKTDTTVLTPPSLDLQLCIEIQQITAAALWHPCCPSPSHSVLFQLVRQGMAEQYRNSKSLAARIEIGHSHE